VIVTRQSDSNLMRRYIRVSKFERSLCTSMYGVCAYIILSSKQYYSLLNSVIAGFSLFVAADMCICIVLFPYNSIGMEITKRLPVDKALLVYF